MRAKRDGDRKPLGRPPSTSSEQTKREILRAARKCFARYGYEKTTNKLIASEANLTAGSLYHYFDSKSELFAAVTSEVLVLFEEGFQGAITNDLPLVDNLIELFDVAISLYESDRSLSDFIAILPIEANRAGGLDEVTRMLLSSSLQHLVSLVTEAQKSGEISPDVDRTAVVRALAAAFAGLALLGTTVDDPAKYREIADGFKKLVTGSLLRAPVGLSRG
ncbi:MAG: TetR/AcrR family transcriptional regulator [Acidimicrobiia bacterium]